MHRRLSTGSVNPHSLQSQHAIFGARELNRIPGRPCTARLTRDLIAPPADNRIIDIDLPLLASVQHVYAKRPKGIAVRRGARTNLDSDVSPGVVLQMQNAGRILDERRLTGGRGSSRRCGRQRMTGVCGKSDHTESDARDGVPNDNPNGTINHGELSVWRWPERTSRVEARGRAEKYSYVLRKGRFVLGTRRATPR